MPDDLLPEAAASVQYNASGFSPLYAEHGFYGIMKVSRWRDVYEEAVYLLAKRIVTAAEASPPVGPGGNVPYESLPSAKVPFAEVLAAATARQQKIVDAFGHIRLGGIGDWLGKQIEHSHCFRHNRGVRGRAGLSFS